MHETVKLANLGDNLGKRLQLVLQVHIIWIEFSRKTGQRECGQRLLVSPLKEDMAMMGVNKGCQTHSLL